MDQEKQWHLSRSVPITLIVAIMIQTTGAIWWASAISSKVDALESTVTTQNQSFAQENLRQWDQINKVENLVEQTVSNGRITEALLGKLEAQVEDLKEEVRETNKILRELYDRGSRN